MRVLKTERLCLRWFEPSDVDYVLEQISEAGWKRNISDPGVNDLAAARDWMEAKLFNWYWPQGLGLWAMERLSDGVVVGMCGLLQRDYLQSLDIGYALLPRYEGAGYVREAAQACRAYANEVLGEPLLFGMTATFNEASGRVLQAIGMQRLSTGPLGDSTEDSHLYGVGEANRLSEDGQVRDLLARFFAVFDNRIGRHAPLAALPYFFLPEAVISRASLPGEAAGVQRMSVREFVEPRVQMLAPGGRLQEFSEWVSEQQVQVSGRVAQVWLRYRKSGILDGQAFEGGGEKTVQLVKPGRRWKIAAIAWQDRD
jgi:RimJ/RimL family protein N-acetyltransferase